MCVLLCVNVTHYSSYGVNAHAEKYEDTYGSLQN